MNTDRQEDSLDNLLELDESVEMVPAKSSTKSALPPGLTDEDSQAFRERATLAVQKLEEATGSMEMELVDSISSVGMEAQAQTGGKLELLRERIGAIVMEDGPGGKVTEDLVSLRVTLSRINPHKRTDSGALRVINSIPLLNRYDPLVRRLEKIAIRYETISTQVKSIEDSLREGRRMLVGDNVELRTLYQQIEAQQLVVRRNAYLGELLVEELEEALERCDDASKNSKMQEALYEVSIRVQDLRSLETVYQQLFTGIDITRQNNRTLGRSVDRVLALATNVVMVGLALQAALARQKRVKDAADRTKRFVGELLVKNAIAINKHTKEIGDIYNDPLVAMDKLARAHDELSEAIDTLDRIKVEGIANARENISILRERSEELREKSAGLYEERKGKSVEAF